MSEMHAAHAKPLSGVQSLSESCGPGLRWQNLVLMIVQSAIVIFYKTLLVITTSKLYILHCDF